MSRSYNDTTTFVDLLFNCVVGFVFLFMLAFIQIDPEEKSKADIKTKAEYIITMTWPLEDHSDVDIWIEDPAGHLIGFKQKEGGLTHLDRDDLGSLNDKFVMPDGRIVEYEYNQEIVTIRGFIPGDWTINVHLYTKRQTAPTKVHVRIDKLNPKVTTVFNKVITLDRHWQEKTVIRFTMTETGEMIGVHDRFVSLIAKHPALAGRITSTDESTLAPGPRRSGPAGGGR